MIDKDIIAAIRLETADDTELTESLRAHGWRKEFPAIQDENGLMLVGNRRLRIAKAIGIKPVITTVTFGDGEAADDQRMIVALTSNVGGAPTTKAERQQLAITLYQRLNWTMQRIGDALGVSKVTVHNYLDGIVNELNNSPAREEKRGRPKGRVEKPRKYAPEVEKKAAELFLDEGKSVLQTSKQLGVSEQVVIRATERERGRREVQAEPVVDRSDLSLTAQQKLDAALARYRKELDLSFNDRVRAERLRRDEVWLAEELEVFRKAEQRNAGYRGCITPPQFRDLQRCLHTDLLDGIAKQGTVDPSIRKRFDAALILLNGLKAVLVSEDRQAPPVPSWDEMMRRREEVRAKNRANAMKGAATRKANRHPEGSTPSSRTG